MKKIVFLIVTTLMTSSLFGGSACCSSQGGCKKNKSSQMQEEQKLINEMMHLDRTALQRDKMRAMLMRHKMERDQPLSVLKEKLYNVLTPEQKKELAVRMQNKQ